MTVTNQPRYHHEVIRNLGMHKCILPLNKTQQKLLSVLSVLETFKDLREQAIHKIKKAQVSKPEQNQATSKPISKKPEPEVIKQIPNYQMKEEEFTCRLIKTDEELLSLFNKVGKLKEQRDQLLSELAQRKLSVPKSDPITQRHGMNLNRSPMAKASIKTANQSTAAQDKCILEHLEIIILANKYKDSEKIQDIAEIMKVRIAQKGILEIQKAFLMNEVLLLLNQSKS